MKEFVHGLGTRKNFGEDLVSLQAEALEPLQAFAGAYGATVLSGCAVSPVTTTATITAGVVCIKHPTDGWKIARYAGGSGLTVPGYLKITKAVIDVDYNSGTAPGYNHYTATYHAGSPGALTAEEHILVSNNTDQLKKLVQGMGNVAITAWTNVWSDTEGSIDARLDLERRQVHLSGYFEYNSAYVVGAAVQVDVPLTTLAAKYRPATDQYFGAKHRESGVVLKNFSTGGVITENVMSLESSGALTITAQHHNSASTRRFFINAILNLD